MADPMTEDEQALHGMGYAQELARHMGGFSNFAISFSIICILAGGITAFPVAFSAGGGFSVSIGRVIGGLITVFAITQALFNHFGIRVTTLLTDFSGYLIFVVAMVLTLSMLAWGASFDVTRLFAFVNNTGEPGGLVVPESRGATVAFLIGPLYPLYTMTGFDASAHSSEETINARTTVPKGMLHSVFWSLLFGFFMASSFIMAMPDTTVAAKQGHDSFFNLFNTLPMPEILRDLLAIGIVLANYLCWLAGMTSTSRMIYAFARDGGLPASQRLRPSARGTARR